MEPILLKMQGDEGGFHTHYGVNFDNVGLLIIE